MKTVTFSGRGKVSDLPTLPVLSGLLGKITCSVVELAGQHFSSHKVYEDKITSLGVMTQAASLGNQVLPQRFEIILENKLPINSFC